MTNYRAEIRLYAESVEEFLDGHRESSTRLLADVTVVDSTAGDAIGQLFRHLDALAQRHAPDEPEPAASTEEMECPF